MKCKTCKQFCKQEEDGLCARCRKLEELEKRLENSLENTMEHPLVEVEIKDIDIPEFDLPKSLIESINGYGIIHAPALKKHSDPKSPFKYEIVDGRRRLATAKHLNWTHTEVRLVEWTDTRMLSLGLNFWRSPNPVMEARILMEYITEGLDQTDIASTLGISQGQISKRLSLLKLIPELLEKVEKGQLASNVGYTLAKLSKDEQKGYSESKDRITMKDVEESNRKQVVGNLDMTAIERVPEGADYSAISKQTTLEREIGDIDIMDYKLPLSKDDMAEVKQFIGQIQDNNRTRLYCRVCTKETCATCINYGPSGFVYNHDGLAQNQPKVSEKVETPSESTVKCLPAKEGYGVKGSWFIKNKSDVEGKIQNEEEFTTKENQSVIDTIDEFNRSLRPGEKERELFEVIEEEYVKLHRWSDKINLIGLKDKSGIYDKYECLDCGLVYKRRTLDWNPPRNSNEPCKPKKK